MYRILAAAVVLVHLGFIVFVAAGGVLVLRWPRLAWLHLPAALWGVLVEVGGWTCPLTPLENHFRRLAGLASYEGDFIGRYLLPLIYPGELTPALRYLLAAALVVINAAVYALLLRRRRLRRPLNGAASRR